MGPDVEAMKFVLPFAPDYRLQIAGLGSPLRGSPTILTDAMTEGLLEL